MSDDWRLRIHVHDPEHAVQMGEQLAAWNLQDELEAAFHDRVAISGEGNEAFCYTATREQAERVREMISSLASEKGWQLDIELARWHPVAEEWEDPDKPLPSSETDVDAEHAELMTREREEATEQGYPDFEVRVHCRSRSSAIELGDRLRAEGIPSVRRFHYLLVGAPDEDTAAALAKRIADESPPGAVVTTEGTGRDAYAARPNNPFSIFGGLGG
jgi:hypothetical protein